MSHLPTERLAALADEQPNAEELVHLAGCSECAGEREAYRSLLELSRTAQIGVPLTSWASIESALVRDGIIDRGAAPRRDRQEWARRILQVAAGFLLVAGGISAGRLTAGTSPIPGIGGDQTVRSAAVTPAGGTGSESFASRDEALEARRLAEISYQNASAALARFDSSVYAPDSPAAIRTRLAALDRVGETMREALHEAPADPVINGYYLTTLDQREATLRQLNTALPSAVRLNSF